MSRLRPLVIKASGSLLSESGAIDRLAVWLDGHAVREPRSWRLLLVGGGEPVEVLRQIDRANPLPESVTHWAAIEQLDVNARLAGRWLPRWRLRDDLEDVPAGDWLVSPGRFLREVEPTLPGTRLPIGWQTTSDSIACRLAICLQADLLLLKRCDPPTEGEVPGGWDRLAEAGFVDRCFPQLARNAQNLRISVANIA